MTTLKSLSTRGPTMRTLMIQKRQTYILKILIQALKKLLLLSAWNSCLQRNLKRQRRREFKISQQRRNKLLKRKRRRIQRKKEDSWDTYDKSETFVTPEKRRRRRSVKTQIWLKFCQTLLNLKRRLTTKMSYPRRMNEKEKVQ